MSKYIKQRSWKKELGSYFLPKALLGIDLNKYQEVMTGALQGYNASMGTSDPGGQAYATTMGAVSKAGPVGLVIGGITAIGDAIGNPIRLRSERTDATGGLVDEGKAARVANVGGGLNPFKSLTRTFGDKNATRKEKVGAVANMLLPGLGIAFGFGKARAKRLDEEGRKEVSEAFSKQANMVFGNMLNAQLKMGGELNDNKGGIVDYKGATHEQGGIKVDKNGNPSATTGGKAIAEVETNEFKFGGYIFSNTLKYND